MEQINLKKFKAIVEAILNDQMQDKQIAIIPDCNWGFDQIAHYLNEFDNGSSIAVRIDTTLPCPENQLPQTYNHTKTKLFFSSLWNDGSFVRPLYCSKETGVALIILVQPDALASVYTECFDVMKFCTEFPDDYYFYPDYNRCQMAIESVLYTLGDNSFIVFENPIKVLDAEDDSIHKIVAAGKPKGVYGFIVCDLQPTGELKWNQLSSKLELCLPTIYEQLVDNLDSATNRVEADRRIERLFC